METCILRLSRVSMGTEFQALLAGSDPDFLRDAGTQALDEVERLEERLSHYRPDSEICDLNLRAPHEAVRMEPSLFRLLARAVALGERTEGAFDPAMGALIRCWGFFRGQGRLAEAEAVREALEQSGARHLVLDPKALTVRFRREGVHVHLGAIGKGYAVDLAVAALRELGVEAALVHGGTSTVYALGAPPGADAWEVGLCDPGNRGRRMGVVRLRDRALSTSGDYEQFFEADGRRYSHILDPRTGWPAQGVRSATVLADNATDTDALSTGVFVLGEPGARRLLTEDAELGIILVPDVVSQTVETRARDVLILGDVALEPGDDEENHPDE